jgi:hypothetical protein
LSTEVPQETSNTGEMHGWHTISSPASWSRLPAALHTTGQCLATAVGEWSLIVLTALRLHIARLSKSSAQKAHEVKT